MDKVMCVFHKAKKVCSLSRISDLSELCKEPIFLTIMEVAIVANFIFVLDGFGNPDSFQNSII